MYMPERFRGVYIILGVAIFTTRADKIQSLIWTPYVT